MAEILRKYTFPKERKKKVWKTAENPNETHHVVMFSGGIGSWATARRVADQHGTDNLVLLFADTKVEDEDTYRFLEDAAAQISAPLVKVEDGRTPFEVFNDDHFLGNSRLANCSKYLKQKPCREWLRENRSPDNTILYVGIDWSESHRLPAIVNGWKPFEVKSPLTEPPYLDKEQIINLASSLNLSPPKAYELGYPHANCLAQGCVRGGQAYWGLILKNSPEVFRRSEEEEKKIQQTEWGKNASILVSRAGGTITPLPLAELRERIEAESPLVDHEEWGGCGCFTDE